MYSVEFLSESGKIGEFSLYVFGKFVKSRSTRKTGRKRVRKKDKKKERERGKKIVGETGKWEKEFERMRQKDK